MSRIPALPIAIKNLLALHGLEAEAESQGWNRRGNKVWLWKITKVNEPNPTELKYNIHGKPVVHTFKKPAVFYMNTSDGLQRWMGYVEAYAIDGHVLTSSRSPNSPISGRWNGNRPSHWIVDDLSSISGVNKYAKK